MPELVAATGIGPLGGFTLFQVNPTAAFTLVTNAVLCVSGTFPLERSVSFMLSEALAECGRFLFVSQSSREESLLSDPLTRSKQRMTPLSLVLMLTQLLVSHEYVLWHFVRNLLMHT